MVSESEILTSFLLERTDLRDALPKEKFKKMFPKNTPDSVIKETRQVLSNQMKRRLENVNSSIHDWSSSSQDMPGEAAERFSSKDKRRKAALATENLRKISDLLDQEITKLEELHESSLNELKKRVGSLNDVAYPTKRESAVQSETVGDIVDLLKALEKCRGSD